MHFFLICFFLGRTVYTCIFSVQLLKNLNDLLFSSYQNLNFELNPIILSTLLAQGFRHTNSDYLLFLFDYLRVNKIQMNSFLVLKIESSLESKKKKILEYERRLSRKECESTDHYKLITQFFSRVGPAFLELQKHVKVEDIRHPYEKFSRGSNDKLFHSFKKRTEGMKLRTDIN